MKTESRIGDSEFGVAADDGVSGESSVIAEIYKVGSSII